MSYRECRVTNLEEVEPGATNTSIKVINMKILFFRRAVL
jgi:hypothetical protein